MFWDWTGIIVYSGLFSELSSIPCQTSKIEVFGEIVNSFQSLTSSAKGSILNVGLGSEYVSEQNSCSNFCLLMPDSI